MPLFVKTMGQWRQTPTVSAKVHLEGPEVAHIGEWHSVYRTYCAVADTVTSVVLFNGTSRFVAVITSRGRGRLSSRLPVRVLRTDGSYFVASLSPVVIDDVTYTALYWADGATNAPASGSDIALFRSLLEEIEPLTRTRTDGSSA
jgi:hypothetical protein